MIKALQSKRLKLKKQSMKKNKHIIAYCILLFLYTGKFKAQLSGAYAVPGTYTSIAAVISDLNTLGVSSGVTINIAAGYTETAPQGGFQLNAIAGASSTSQVVFQKSGSGANPVVSAYTSGYNTPASNKGDGVWSFAGTDWVTIDGINITDPNTVNPSTMEFGFGFFKASGVDGCQNNTIKNCVITLNRINNASGLNVSLEGSKAINVENAAVNNHTLALTVTSAAGANSNNKFYSNTFQNCNVGVALYGFAAVSPFSLADTGNDVGGNSISTGNTFLNYGGGGTTAPASAVLCFNQYDVNISYNTINNNNGSGVNHANTLRGIWLSNGNNSNISITNNTITVKGGGTTQQVSAIENAAGTSGTTNTLTVANNLITGCSYSTATTGVFYNIYNSTSVANINITGNTILNNSTNATSGSYYGIYNSGATPSLNTISNNTISGITFSAASTSAVFRGIYNTTGATTTSLNIVGNSVSSFTHVGTATGETSGIYNSLACIVENMKDNRVFDMNINSSGTCYMLYNSNSMPANGIRTVSGNTVTTINKTRSGGTLYGYYTNGTSSTSSFEYDLNNSISNMTVIAATGLVGIQSSDGTGPAKAVNNNTVTNLFGGTSAITGIVGTFQSSTIAGTITANQVSNVTCSCVAIGMTMGSGLSNTFDNTISSFTTNAASLSAGFNVTSGNHNIFKNKVYNITNIGGTGSVAGMNITGGTLNNIYNNVIGDLKTPNTSGTNQLSGMILAGGTQNVYNNSVYLDGANSGANFGSSALYIQNSAIALDVRNNIFVNNTIGRGTGLAVALRNSGTATTNYATTSNNNIFYAGTPSANNAVYFDGTNTYLTLAAYQAAMVNRDQGSFYENSPFISTVGGNANFLRISTTLATYAENAATSLTLVTDDHVGTSRSLTTPDIGAFEGTYVPYSACSGTPPAVSAVASASMLCTGAPFVIGLPSTYTNTGFTYQWQKSITGVAGPFLSVAGATTQAYASTMPLNNIVYRAVISCGSSTVASAPVGINVGVDLTGMAALATSTTLCAGSTAAITLTNSTFLGAGYQWQVSTGTSAGPYLSMSGATLSTLSATNVVSDSWYQAVISCTANPSASVITAPAAVNVASLNITPTTAAGNTIICPNSTSALSLLNVPGISGLSYQWQSSTGGAGGPFTAISSATTSAYTATVAATTWYQAVISCTSNPSSTVASAPIQVTAGTPTFAPLSTSGTSIVCPNGTTALNLTGNTGFTGIQYQWQSASASTGPYTTVNSVSTTAAYTATLGTLSTWYQAIITCTADPTFSVLSTPVLADVGSTVIPTAIAATPSLCANATSVLNLTTTALVPSGVAYQWYISATGAPGSFTTVSATATTVPYTATVTGSAFYQAIATCTSNTSFSIASTPVQVNVTSPTITPVAVANYPFACSGGSVSLSITNNSGPVGLRYQWQSSTSGASGPYTAINGGTLATLAGTNITANTWYQAVVSCTSSASNSVVTNPVQITPSSPLINPIAVAASTSQCNNATSALTLNNNTGFNSPIAYQWMVSTSGPSGPFTNAPGTSTTAAYTATSNTTSWYMAVINCTTNPTATVASSPVQVSTGLQSFTPNAVAATTVGCGNVTSALSLSGVLGTGLAYQWLASTTASNSGFANAAGTSTTAAYTATIGATTWYQAVVSCSASPSSSIISNVVVVNASIPSMTAIAAAASTLICPARTDALSLTGIVGTGLAYQWQASTTGSAGAYAAIPSATTAAYTATTTTSSTWYQAVISCSANSSSSVASSPILVNVAVPIATSVTALSNSTLLCTGNSINLSLSASAGTGVLYQWYASSTSSSTGFAAISNATNATLSNTVGVNGNNWYQAIVTCSTDPTFSIAAVPVAVTQSVGPTASISAVTSTVCAYSTFTLSGGTDVGTNFNWRGPSSYTSNVQNPVLTNAAAGIYTLQTTIATCSSIPATFTLTTTGAFSGGNVSVNPALLCAGGTATLSTSLPTGPISSYTFIPSTGVNMLTLGASSVQLIGTGNDDGFALGNIGFTFNFGGVDYTQFQATPNGYILMGPAGGTGEWDNSVYPSANNPNRARISPYFDDQATGSAAGGGYIKAETQGVAPTRTCVIEWFTAIPYNTSAAANSKYQLLLYEGSNDIRFIYGTLAADAAGLSRCGLEANTTTGPFHSVTYTGPTSSTLTMNNANSTQPPVTTSYLFTSALLAGLTYTWAPSASLSSTTGISVTSSPLGSTNYSLNLTYQGCDASRTVAVGITPAPTVAVSVSNPSVCPGGSSTITATGAAAYSVNGVVSPTAFVVSPFATTSFTVVGQNGACGTDTQVVSVNVNTTNVNVSGSSGICSGQTASFTASGASTYTWSTGASTSSITDTPPTNGTYTYGVVGTDGAGCITGTTQILNVSAGLAIGITGPSTICVGQSVALTGTGGVTYVWDAGAGSATTNTVSVSPSANTTYTVIGSSGTCSNSAVKTISVNANPTVNVSGNFTVCSTSPTTLTASGANTYSWSTTAITASTIVSPTLTTTYSVTGTSSVGCQVTQTVAVTTNTLPVLTITSAGGATAVCNSSSHTLTANGANTYSWVGGPGTAAYTFTPTGAAVYTVDGLTSQGCAASKTISLGSYTLPVVAIAPASATVCLTSSASFTASGASSYIWNASTTNTNATYTVVPTASTVYTVLGTTTDGCTGTQTVSVLSNTIPAMSVTPLTTTVCTASFATFTATGTGAVSYTWDVTGVQTAVGSFYQGGPSTHTVTATNALGCSASATVAVSTYSLPVLAPTPSFTTVCASTPITFSVSGANSYTWTTGNVVSNTVVLTPTASIAYSVSGTSSDGCVSGALVTVVTKTLPVIGITPATPTVCSLSAVNFTASGANTYVWNGTVNTATISLTPTTSTVYTVVGTSTANSCSASKTVAVTTNSLPNVGIATTAASVCLGSGALLTASGASTYVWSDATTDNTLAVVPTANTNYTVTGTDSKGCVSSKTITISTWALPNVQITPSVQTICAKDPAGATYTASGASTYSWLAASSTSVEVGTTYSTQPLSTSFYTVVGTDANGCLNALTFILTVDPCTGIGEKTLNSDLIRIYPNPSNGMINMDFGFDGNKNIVIMNSVGALITNLTTSNPSESFDLSELAKGVYFIKVSSTQGAGNYKVIVE